MKEDLIGEQEDGKGQGKKPYPDMKGVQVYRKKRKLPAEI